MRINQLEFFISSTKNGSFSKAAKELYVTQPAVSQGIRELEEELGVNLFVRERNGLRLTIEGETILPMAESVLQTIRQIHTFSKKASGRSNKYRIAATRYIYNTIIYAIDREMRELESGVHIEFVLNDGLNLMQAVLDNQLECGIVQLFEVEQEELEQMIRRGLVVERLWRESYMFYCRADHPLAKAGAVTLDDIYGYDIVSYLAVPEAPIRRTMEERHFENRLINIHDIISVRKYLLATNAIGFTPHAGFVTMLDDFGHGLVPLYTEKALFDYDICLVYTGRTLNATDQAVFSMIRKFQNMLVPYPGLNDGSG